MADALLEHDGSGRQAFQRADQAGQLPTSQEAVYGKLRRLPISLSNGILFDATRRLEEVLPAVVAMNGAPQRNHRDHPKIPGAHTSLH